mmetsp:Transcript_15568/g.39460  ORF Transcript_15568/g.39460 Transcript_15568/m.39460 type:complete len:132 (-) Transcript_15568:283-678(-)
MFLLTTGAVANCCRLSAGGVPGVGAETPGDGDGALVEMVTCVCVGEYALVLEPGASTGAPVRVATQEAGYCAAPCAGRSPGWVVGMVKDDGRDSGMRRGDGLPLIRCAISTGVVDRKPRVSSRQPEVAPWR